MSSDENKTMPTLDAIMERINQLGERLEARLDSIEKEMREGFAKLNRKLDLLNNELLDVKAENVKQNERLDDLERKAS